MHSNMKMAGAMGTTTKVCNSGQNCTLTQKYIVNGIHCTDILICPTNSYLNLERKSKVQMCQQAI